MDTVCIHGLEIATVIGVYDWERNLRQIVVLDLEMATDVARAAASDALDDALDYAAVAMRLEQLVGSSSFQLIETLAERCAQLVQREFGVRWLRLTVSKPGAVASARNISVTIERGART